MTLFSKDCRFYLARQTGPMSVELVDGCHGSPEGVAKGAALHERIFGARADEWLMVEMHPMPAADGVAINEDAAEVCRQLVDDARVTSSESTTTTDIQDIIGPPPSYQALGRWIDVG